MRGYDFLVETFHRLKALYQKEGLEPGILKKIGMKSGWTVLIGTGGQCGMAINFTGIHHLYDSPEIDLEELKSLIGKNLVDIADEHLESENVRVRSLGMAAVNALSQPLISPESLLKRGFGVEEGPGYIKEIVRKEDVVTLVGYGGMAWMLSEICRELHVTDLRPLHRMQTTIIGHEIEYGPNIFFLHEAEDNEMVLAKSDVAIITASSLLNNTFNDLMDYASKARHIGLYGPSASLIPDVFFEKGVSLILSHRITDPARFEFSMVNDRNMERGLKEFQKQQVIRR